MKGRKVVKFDPAEYAAGAARLIGQLVVDAVSKRGRCALALAGGSTPMPVYRAMAKTEFAPAIPWDKVDVYFGDERCVPPDHKDSNYGAARLVLMAHAPIPSANVHPMDGGRPDREAAARDYEGLLPERLDVLLLGVGPDGHTASLFPDSPALFETTRRVVSVIGPRLPAERLTITPPVIAAAMNVVVMVTGADKAAVVARVLEGSASPTELPAWLARGGTWVLDTPAAGELRDKGKGKGGKGNGDRTKAGPAVR